ncbi:MAG: SDR family NAD(P)-dependent oxidoreductase [Actinomycetia bacterium]|nr:SDR family NAD(P)-dependent oxidoreductase [Actinomycetes bacterium]
MSDKKALVTGGSRGIGAAISVQLAKDGYDIFINYRSNEEAALKVKEAVEAEGRECTLLKFDVADIEAVKSALKPLLENIFIDVLVNNAGITKDPDPA